VTPVESDFPMRVVRFFARMMPLLWVLSAFAWWWLPFRSAMGITMTLAVLSVVTRSYRRRTVRFPSSPRVRVAEPGQARGADERWREEEEEEEEDNLQARRRR
jgi:hypothetical protein